MAYYRNYWRSLGAAVLSCVAIVFVSLTALTPFSPVGNYRDAFSAPVLPPLVELTYQAVLADQHALPASDINLNDRLRSIDIRTALEDTRRLRFDLG